MLDKSEICSKYIKRIGREVSILKKDNGEDKLLAVVQSIWRGGKVRYEKHHSEIGMNLDDYCSFICPSDYDITALSEDDIVEFENKKFHFVHTESVVVANKVQFYAGIIKRNWEAEDVFVQ